MALNYNLIVQETLPDKKAPGTYWLKKSVGLVSIALGDGKYNHLAAGDGNLSIADGTYFLQVSEGASPPTSPQPGQLWFQNNKTYWIYLGQWVPFGGN